jgi:hypothetical protein
MKAVAERAWGDRLRIIIVVERDEPIKALSISPACAPRSDGVRGQHVGISIRDLTKAHSPLNLMLPRSVVH